MPPPEVLVSLPVTREVTDYEDFPGRTEAVSSIEVRARVTGYLDKMNFREGAEVKQGEVLFEIDPRPYKAQQDQDAADLENRKAVVVKTEAAYKRSSSLLKSGASNQEDVENQRAEWDVAKAWVGQAEAKLRLSQLNLDWTRVTAPISGRISRRFVDPGNLIKADDTVLTTIVSLDPIYAYFDVDERTTLRLQKLVRDKKITWSVEQGLPVYLGLADETGFPHQGAVLFSDNRVDADTGTWRQRGVFKNADQALTPGLFVRIRLPIGNPYQATLVAEQALSTDQGQKYVYVLDDDNQVTYRRIKVGRVHDGMRVITEGVKPNEKVIVSGLQRVRQGIKVEPKVVPMPSGAAKPDADAPKPNDQDKKASGTPAAPADKQK